MNSNIKSILIAIIAIGFGLGAGYFIFGNKQSTIVPEGHNHEADVSMTTPGEEAIWTCSMHPQIRQNEPGQCPICEMDLIPLEANTSNDPLVLQMTTEAVKLANIQTTIVGATGKAEKTIQLTGKIQEDERRAVSQVVHIPGRIEKLFVTFTGEQIQKGQKLATIYSPELITAQRELLEAVKFQDVNANLLEAARNKLRYWKIPNNTIGEIEKSETIKETFTVLAESSGIVTNRQVSVGDYVKQGQVLFGLTNLSKVWVLFDAYEEDLNNIRIGDKIEFSAAALPDKKFSTRITFIDPVINPKTRVASLRTEVNNSSGLLKPEMFVRGIIQSKPSGKVQLTIPKSAVLWTGTRSVVYVKIPDMEIPSYEYKEVVLGTEVGRNYLVESGLEAGDEVVTNGNFTIDAAAQLNNQQSMMNKVVKVKNEEAPGVPNYQEDTPPVFKNQLTQLADKYIALKDAFVATDPKTASTKAQNFLQQLEKVDMSLVKGDAHLYWMEQLKALGAHCKKITELDDVEAQRRQFGFLSDALIKTLQAFGTDGKDLFVQFCPMAFDNEGADWLALEKTIQNPYFGEKMMKCGTVKVNLSQRREGR